jgi:hypothetical protein
MPSSGISADPAACYQDLGTSFLDTRYRQRLQHNLLTSSNASPAGAAHPG